MSDVATALGFFVVVLLGVLAIAVLEVCLLVVAYEFCAWRRRRRQRRRQGWLTESRRPG